MNLYGNGCGVIKTALWGCKRADQPLCSSRFAFLIYRKSAFSGRRLDKASQFFLLFFLDPIQCPRQYHAQGKTPAKLHLFKPADEVVLKAEGDIQPSPKLFEHWALPGFFLLL